MEATAAASAQQGDESLDPDDLLRQVGWFNDDDEVEAPNDALADFEDEPEAEDPGEDYPDDDGVEPV